MIEQETRQVLQKVERALQEDAFEASVFLMPSGSIVAFAMTTWHGHNCRYNIGTRPLRNRLREATGNQALDVQRWFQQLRGTAPAGVPAPATIWNTRHLLITEGTSEERLVTIFEHPESWRPEELAEVATQLGAEKVEDLELMFQNATQRRLPERAKRHYLTKVAIGQRPGSPSVRSDH